MAEFLNFNGLARYDQKIKEVINKSGVQDVSVALDNDNNNVKLLLLDNNGVTKHTMTIPAATASSIGLMTAQDKQNLNALNSHELFQVVSANTEGLPNVDNDSRRSDVIYLVYKGGDESNNVLNEYVWVEVANELTGSTEYQWEKIGQFNVNELYTIAAEGELIGGSDDEAPYVAGTVKVEGDGVSEPWVIKVELSHLASVLYYLDNIILGNNPIANGGYLEYKGNTDTLQNHLNTIADETVRRREIDLGGGTATLDEADAFWLYNNILTESTNPATKKADVYFRLTGNLYHCNLSLGFDNNIWELYCDCLTESQGLRKVATLSYNADTYKISVYSQNTYYAVTRNEDVNTYLNGAGQYSRPILSYQLPNKGTISLTEYYNLRYWDNTPIFVRFTYPNNEGYPLGGYVTQVQALDTGIIIKAISYQKQSESVVKLVEVTCSINTAGYVEWSTKEVFDYNYEDNTLNTLSNQKAYTENVSDIYTQFSEDVPTAFVDTMKADGTNEKVQMLYDPLYKTIQMRTYIGNDWSNWEIVNKKEVYVVDIDVIDIADTRSVNSTLLKELHKNYFGGVACYFKVGGVLQPITYSYVGGETTIVSYDLGNIGATLRFEGDASLFADEKDIEIALSGGGIILTSYNAITNSEIDALFT